MVEPRQDSVGPVLEASETGRLLAQAIVDLNPGASVEDRGAYLRILAPGRCLLTREAAEQALGRPFRLPLDLEPLMPAFKGLIQIDERRVEWSFGRQ